MFLSSLVLAFVAAASASPAQCSFNRNAMLALDQQAFDQDMNGGWRAVAKQPNCALAAAELIRDYRTHHGLDNWLLFWHEGQLRAGAGEAREAIKLFEGAYRKEDPIGWNHYVAGNIAFLRQDRERLLAARDALARVPEPEDRARDRAEKTARGEPVPDWPPNLKILDGFLSCFGRPYPEASRCSASGS
jgi:hypothetical protein